MDKNLPDLPIYSQFDTPKEGRLITLLIAGVFVPIAVGYALLNGPSSFSFEEIGWVLMSVYALMLIFWIGLVFYLFRQYRIQRAADYRDRMEFQTKALTTQAKIVGRHKDEDGEGIAYYIFYQFKPDFIVKVMLKSSQQHLFELPNGSEIRIEYIPNEPSKTRMK